MQQRNPTLAEDPRLRAYRPAPGVADELFDAEGRLRPVWQPFVDQFLGLSPDDIAARFERGDQYLREAGVYFRRYSSEPMQEREWPLSHVPVILGGGEWETICEGLAERADLLDAILADLYGPGRLVADGHLPAELVAGNPQWLRPMVGVEPRGGHYLHYIAFEIGRSPDGSWFVLGDRTQAPSGAGFALENRMATSRVFPEVFSGEHIHRLAGFFRDFRSAIEGLAGRHNGLPRRAGILTPGPANDAYYEHTYIARYLGIPLLEGEDLLVQDGTAMIRTIEGPQPLGVLWRRIDAGFADPLELDPGSQIGTPGLMEAVRLGNLAMVNALGSGILETRAMLAFVPRIAEVLTGRPLKLPNIATWWCGARAERDYVRQNARRMMIGPALAVDLPFDANAATALGGKFRDNADRPIAEWLDREGAHLVGQEAVTLSTTPSWRATEAGGTLRPRPMTVRVFAARTRHGWSFMPGGYARIGAEADATALGMQRGGMVADVWIVSERPVPQVSLVAPPKVEFRRESQGTLPARAADNLYWLGRYVERCEDAMRLIRAYHLRLAASERRDGPLLVQLESFLDGRGINVDEVVPAVLLDRITAARSCAAKIRDRFSTDGWLALYDLQKTARGMTETARPGDDAARAMGVLLRKITGFSGLVHENMYRSSGWRFLSAGRALERADFLASLLSAFTDPEAPYGSLDLAVEVADSVITHQRRYRIETSRDTVVDLLAIDDHNPRAILFQMNELRGLAQGLPHARVDGSPAALLRAILPVCTRFEVAAPSDLTLASFEEVRDDLYRISDLLTQTYLR
ncbi:MAG TPA: circularly permuted type 2 ATP-grasp protein [Albidovulum sp.]|uniref:circularly permuted type 2 ATP-grasp protein n=1 Tax=Albidovulum sp. TaxID=1872424 RepID=UPI002C45AB9C|nr:circularly permuted type 2 ATP-grasp protein [Albidovulum sp.]